MSKHQQPQIIHQPNKPSANHKTNEETNSRSMQVQLNTSHLWIQEKDKSLEMLFEILKIELIFPKRLLLFMMLT